MWHLKLFREELVKTFECLSFCMVPHHQNSVNMAIVKLNWLKNKILRWIPLAFQPWISGALHDRVDAVTLNAPSLLYFDDVEPYNKNWHTFFLFFNSGPHPGMLQYSENHLHERQFKHHHNRDHMIAIHGVKTSCIASLMRLLLHQW
jgi:hypothetical protein